MPVACPSVVYDDAGPPSSAICRNLAIWRCRRLLSLAGRPMPARLVDCAGKRRKAAPSLVRHRGGGGMDREFADMGHGEASLTPRRKWRTLLLDKLDSRHTSSDLLASLAKSAGGSLQITFSESRGWLCLRIAQKLSTCSLSTAYDQRYMRQIRY